MVHSRGKLNGFAEGITSVKFEDFEVESTDLNGNGEKRRKKKERKKS